MNYDVNYFIAKFTAIPEENWTIGQYTKNDQHCAIGHCGWINSFSYSKEANDLLDLFEKNGFTSVAKVNDGKDDRFTQATPKGRILAALDYIKSKNK